MKAVHSDLLAEVRDLQETEQKALAISTLHDIGASSGGAARPCHAHEADAWIKSLRGSGRRRDDAIGQLYDLLLRAARFELSRRRAGLSHVPDAELTDITMKAAADALVVVLAKLDDFRGVSSFRTWAYKFAIREASVKLRSAASSQETIAAHRTRSVTARGYIVDPMES